MAVRRILQLGDPKLREVSRPVQAADTADILRDLEDTLAEFRRTHGFGRGISAVQIGVPLRVIFMQVDGRRYELINPEFTFQSEEKFILFDDCFSFPGIMVRLERHKVVRLKYQDRAGDWRDLEAADALSELIQHEMEHLDGVLAVDHARTPQDLVTRAAYLQQQHT